MKYGILYIVATPIGNLGDITLRALETLKKVDLIACEDTRQTKKILLHFVFEKPLISFHQHSKAVKFDKIIQSLLAGANVALVTDAGTPGISDPGNKLVEAALQNEIAVIPIPGVSALTTLASVSGIDMTQFTFLGFPPHKKGRETFFKKVAALEMPAVYYESPHRLVKNLELLSVIANEVKQSNLKNIRSPRPSGTRDDIHIILGRELTKMFEEIVRGSVENVLEYFNSNLGKVKGEITIIVY